MPASGQPARQTTTYYYNWRILDCQYGVQYTWNCLLIKLFLNMRVLSPDGKKAVSNATPWKASKYQLCPINTIAHSKTPTAPKMTNSLPLEQLAISGTPVEAKCKRESVAKRVLGCFEVLTSRLTILRVRNFFSMIIMWNYVSIHLKNTKVKYRYSDNAMGADNILNVVYWKVYTRN